MKLENGNSKYLVLVSIDNEYFWLTTTARSKAAAKNNTYAIAGVIIANNDSVNLARYLTAKKNMIKIFIDDEIDKNKWELATPLRKVEDQIKPMLPSQIQKSNTLVDKTERFMNKFYGNTPSGVISSDVDMVKLLSLAKTNGFSESEIKNHEFQSTVNAYIYKRLK